MTRVIFEFPDEKAAEAFLAWFSDGNGEQDFFQSEEYHAEEEGRKKINHFDFAKAFPAWGYNPKVDGPDRVVKAEIIDGP